MKEAIIKGMIYSTVIVVIGWGITRIWPTQIINIFIKDDIELMNISLEAMRLELLAFPIIGFKIIGSSYFQAVGKFKEAIFLSLFPQKSNFIRDNEKNELICVLLKKWYKYTIMLTESYYG